MELVAILLRFTRATRDGNWELYLSAFAEMFPWFALYDHVNYTRWGTVFLADMKQLQTTAPDVYGGFLDGDFVVKEMPGRFNQVPDDQGLQHVNKMDKVSGGLIGITRTEAALDRWSLTYNERACLAEDTKVMFGLLSNEDEDDDKTHRDSGSLRWKRDHHDLTKLEEKLMDVRVFEHLEEDLICITTRDVAPDYIKSDLETASERGKQNLEQFAKARLVERTESFHSSMKQNKSKTMDSIYSVVVDAGTQKASFIRADRDLFRRVIVANEGGRDVDLDEMLDQELFPVPLSLATTAGKLRTTAKAQLAAILQEGGKVGNKELPNSDLRICTIIDGMAVVQAIGKPSNALTFGDLADIFQRNVYSYFRGNCTRVDVVFDRYLEYSIKGGTRHSRSGKTRPIRRVIDTRNVKLPENWKNFISLGENKANLASFLCDELLSNPPDDTKELVIGGGFADILQTTSSVARDVSQIRANHEEADTGVILHAKDAHLSGYQRTVVACHDTDVLVLLSRHDLSEEVRMETGTKREPNYIAVHLVQCGEEVRSNILAYHAITGCDTTSQFAGIGKRSSWKIFPENPHFLDDLGKELKPDETVLSKAENFVCKLYVPSTEVSSIHEIRCSLFRRTQTNLENLPPTKDALVQHIRRAHYQTLVWRQCMASEPELPPATESDWKIKDNILQPLLTTKESVSKQCLQLMTCGCKTSEAPCQSRRCNCTKRGLRCIRSCVCAGSCRNSENIQQDFD